MTCTHVLGLIDAAPFADYPRAHLDAAWDHARTCATCGPALKAATALGSELSALPPVQAPSAMTASIMARVARLEPVEAAADRHAVPAGKPVPRFTAGLPTWSVALGTILAAVVLNSEGPDGVGAWSRFAPLAIGPMDMPTTATAGVLLFVGLLIYAGGLFGQVRDRTHER